MESGQGPQQSLQRHYVPPWLQTPRGATPGVLALELLLARTEKVAVAIPRLYGYLEGFEIELHVVSGADGRELDTRLDRASQAGRLQPDAHGRLPAEMLRLAVQFADGSSVTNVTPLARDPTRKPDSPVMHAQGGGGGAGNWRQRLWVWPLPPPGRLTFICEWPALGIPLARGRSRLRTSSTRPRDRKLFAESTCRRRVAGRSRAARRQPIHLLNDARPATPEPSGSIDHQQSPLPLSDRGAVSSSEPRSWTLQEPQTECREHQNNPDVHHQPLPEPVPEEQDVHPDDDGYQRENVKHDSCLSFHRFFYYLCDAFDTLRAQSPRCSAALIDDAQPLLARGRRIRIAHRECCSL